MNKQNTEQNETNLMHCWQDVTLKPLEDSEQYKNGWLICSRGKSFAVYAATATEKQEWMAHIKKCIDDLIRKSGKKAADSYAAVWVRLIMS